jgi:hypothetical protein
MHIKCLYLTTTTLSTATTTTTTTTTATATATAASNGLPGERSQCSDGPEIKKLLAARFSRAYRPTDPETQPITCKTGTRPFPKIRRPGRDAGSPLHLPTMFGMG